MVTKVAYVVRDKDGAFFPNTYSMYKAKFFDTPSEAFRAARDVEIVLKVTYEVDPNTTYERSIMFDTIALDHFSSIAQFFYTFDNAKLFTIDERGYKKIERKKFHLTFRHQNGTSSIIYEGPNGKRWSVSKTSDILYYEGIDFEDFMRFTVQDMLIYG